MLFKKINRIKVHRIPKPGKFWCPSCDRYKVGIGQKCPVCGNKERKVDKP